MLLQTSTDVEELSLFLDEAVAAGTEGLIVKSLDSTYEPSKRSVNWLKLKKDYLQGVGDTFDVVPIGAFYGKRVPSHVYVRALSVAHGADGLCRACRQYGSVAAAALPRG